MELNINSIVKAISKGITKCLETIWNEEGELLDMLLLIREDMIEESETFESLQKSRIYNQYQNESCRRLFQNNNELRLFDFREFTATYSNAYFIVGSCREFRIAPKKEIIECLETDINDIVCYILKNNNKNEITKRLYKELIADNL